MLFDAHVCRALQFNLTHTVNSISFGVAYPGLVNPLDGHEESMEKEDARMFQYFIKVVPTRYIKLNGQQVCSPYLPPPLSPSPEIPFPFPTLSPFKNK